MIVGVNDQKPIFVGIFTTKIYFMSSFGKRLEDCRKAKKMSQKDLADLFGTSNTAIGKYERDLMIPSVQAASKMAKILDTTVGYLLGETEEVNLFKDKKMMDRFNDINELNDKEKESLFLMIDYFIKASKVNKM